MEVYKCQACGRQEEDKVTYLDHLSGHIKELQEVIHQLKEEESQSSTKSNDTEVSLSVNQANSEQQHSNPIRNPRGEKQPDIEVTPSDNEEPPRNEEQSSSAKYLPSNNRPLFLQKNRSIPQEKSPGSHGQPSSKSCSSEKSEATFACDRCDFNCPGKDSHQVNLHRKTHSTTLIITKSRQRESSNDQLACDHCSTTFKSEKGRKYHMKVVHRQQLKNPEGDSYSCNQCDMTFIRKTALEAHGLVHSKKQPFMCDWCGEKFTQSSSMKRHKRVRGHYTEKVEVTREKPKPWHDRKQGKGSQQQLLNQAQEQQKQSGQLQQHVPEQLHEQQQQEQQQQDRHEQQQEEPQPKQQLLDPLEIKEECIERDENGLIRVEVQYPAKDPYRIACTLCDRAFNSIKGCNYHMKMVHRLDRPDGQPELYPCALCDLKFTSESRLKAHDVVHSGVKLFTCEVCEKKFSQKGSMSRHRANCRRRFGEPDEDQPRQQERPLEYPCAYCEAVFAKKSILDIHVQVTHGFQQLIACKHCSKTFKTKAGLQKHVDDAHSSALEAHIIRIEKRN